MQTKPKSSFAKLMLATLAGSLALGTAMSTIVRAESSPDDAATVQALGSAKISLADAIRTAEAAGQGMVVGGEFTMKDGKPVFDVTTQKGGTEMDHLIDPATGAILGSTPAVEKAEGDEEGQKAGDEGTELTALQGAKVTLLQAITTAEAQGGKALSAEYGQENGALAVSLAVADASGKTTELRIDAVTGKVLASGEESGEQGGEGDGEGDGGDSGEEQEG